MLVSNQRNLIIIGAVLLVCAIGAAAIIHNNATNAPLNAPGALASGAYPAGQYAALAQPYAGDYNAAQGAVNGDGYYPLVPRPAYVRQGQSAYAPPAPAPETDDQPVRNTYVERDAPARRTYYVERHHGRSKKHSLEIVGGTAAAGAAIGAVAGGGKGAALGGLSGAGAGFVYDRLTHNR